MMLNAGIVLGHRISFASIRVDPKKIEVIIKMELIKEKLEAFWVMRDIIDTSLKILQKLLPHYLSCLQKKWNFIGPMLAK